MHRDFKPWNINDARGLLFYDFEETITDGPPLEDLLNYIVDPIIRERSAAYVLKKLAADENSRALKRYLNTLGIAVDYETLLHIFLVERAVFWKDAGKAATAQSYLAVMAALTAEQR